MVSRRRKRDLDGRRGYALASVLVFLGVMLTFLAISQRQISSSLRIEKARIQAAFRDESAVQALAQGVKLLETGLPPSDPYVGELAVVTSRGAVSFDVSFASDGSDNWTVNVAPASSFSPTLPATFAD